MTQFKKGDRVQFSATQHRKWFGHEGTIVGYDHNHNACVMLDDFPHPRGSGDDDRDHWVFSEDCLTLIEDPLVAELTAALATLFDQLKTGTSDKSS